MDMRKRIWILVLVLVTVAAGVETIALTVMYRTSFQEQEDRLMNLARSQARLLEAVARFDMAHVGDYPGGAMEATLFQFREAAASRLQLGETGEFTLARRVGDSVAFLLRQGAVEPLAPLSLPISGGLAEPQARALAGESGVVVGRDYSGTRVMAAYEPVRVYDLGIVAKVDLAEIRAPFIRAGILAGAGGILLIVLGSVLFFRVSEPLVDRLRVSERQHRELAGELAAAFHASPLPLFVLDSGGRVQRWNAAAEETFGWGAEEAVGKPLPVVPPDRRGEFEALRDRVLAGESFPGKELRGRRRDGEEVEVRLSTAPIRDADGTVNAIMAVLEDITEEKAAEKALQERTALLEAVTENLPQGILHVFDTEFRYVLSAGEGLAEVGLTHEGLAGKSIHEVLLPDAASMVESRYRKALDGETVRFEGEFGGEWFLVTAAPLRGAGGEVEGIVALSLNVTERRLAEARIRENEERLELALQGADLGFWDVRVPARSWVHSRSLEQWLGYAQGEIDHTLDQWEALLHPEDRDRAVDALERHVRGETEAYEVEYRLRRRGGEYLWIRSHGRAMERDDEGHALRALGTHLDITERKEAEAELRRSRSLLTTVMDNLPVGIAVNSVEPAVDFTYMNDNFPAFYRTTREALAEPDAFWEAVYEDPEFREEIRRRVLEDMASGESGRMVWDDVPIVRQGAETTFISARNIPLPDEGLVVSTVWDVTDRKRAEDLLRASETQYRLLAENTLDVIWTMNMEMELTYVNPAIRRLTGHTPEEWVGSRLSDHTDEAHYAEMLTLVEESVARGPDEKGVVFETEMLRADGTPIPIEIHAKILFDEEGNPEQIQGVTRDITERKEAEAELRNWAAELESRVKERTRALEAANRELEAFSYTVSHDLKAPVRAIDGFSRILEQDHAPRLDEDGLRVLGIIRASTAEMAQLIDDLLAFSRLARAELRQTTVDFRDVVDSVVEDLDLAGEERRVDLTVEDLPTVQGDRLLLRQAMMNLLANAVKFSGGREEPRIRVGSYREGDEVVVFVRDNGVGFDPAFAQKLFEVFQRLHHTDEFPGTGVGLANVRRIVERHGGRVWAEGEPDRGATLYLALPAFKTEKENAS